MDTRRSFLFGVGIAAAGTAGCGVASQPSARVHVVLLGDSIFDNARYVRGKPCVHDQLAKELEGRGAATLLAVDGSVTREVAEQLGQIPADATHLVISSGGNDALRHRSLLDRQVPGSAALFADLAQIQLGFRDTYRRMLDAAVATRKPVAVCTVYDSNFDQPEKGVADVALSIWNDTIVRCAGDAGVPVIDLRRVFTAREDYANPIEPSEIGGQKMVRVIRRVVEQHDFAARATTIYA